MIHWKRHRENSCHLLMWFWIINLLFFNRKNNPHRFTFSPKPQLGFHRWVSCPGDIFLPKGIITRSAKCPNKLGLSVVALRTPLGPAERAFLPLSQRLTSLIILQWKPSSLRLLLYFPQSLGGYQRCLRSLGECYSFPRPHLILSQYTQRTATLSWITSKKSTLLTQSMI